MATKTISLEIDAYERLKASKKPGESFSEVVRRAQFADPVPTGKDLLEWMRRGGSGVSSSYLDEVEQAAALPVEQRASLASFLLYSLPNPNYDVSDEEVAERVRQTKSGEIETISMDELRKGVFADRGR